MLKWTKAIEDWLVDVIETGTKNLKWVNSHFQLIVMAFLITVSLWGMAIVVLNFVVMPYIENMLEQESE